MGVFWYGALIAIALATALAIARLWTAAFTLVLGLTPLAVTLTANEWQGIHIESGTTVAIAVPVGVGLLLLVLQSSGRLILPTRTRRRDSFESV